jgi:hypothetical protein
MTLLVNELEIGFDVERLAGASIAQVSHGSSGERVHLQATRGGERYRLEQAGLGSSVPPDDHGPLPDGLSVGRGEIQLQVSEKLQALDADIAEVHRQQRPTRRCPSSATLSGGTCGELEFSPAW